MKTSSKCLLSGMWLLLFGLGNAMARPITITADVYLYTTSEKPSAGQKSGTVLNVNQRLLVGGTVYGYVHFTPGAQVPKGALIDHAVLRIYLPYNAKNSQNTIEVTASGIARGENNWADLRLLRVGDHFSPNVATRNSVIVKASGDRPHSDAYYEWDVTGLVNDIGAAFDRGAISFRLSANGGIFRFNDQDGSPSPDFPPQLVITTNQAP